MENRVNFRLTDQSVLHSIADEAKRRNISMNEYCRQMAILGHSSLMASNAKSEAIIKTAVVTLTTIRRQIELQHGQDKATELGQAARNDAQVILQSLGIDL